MLFADGFEIVKGVGVCEACGAPTDQINENTTLCQGKGHHVKFDNPNVQEDDTSVAEIIEWLLYGLIIFLVCLIALFFFDVNTMGFHFNQLFTFIDYN